MLHALFHGDERVTGPLLLHLGPRRYVPTACRHYCPRCTPYAAPASVCLRSEGIIDRVVFDVPGYYNPAADCCTLLSQDGTKQAIPQKSRKRAKSLYPLPKLVNSIKSRCINNRRQMQWSTVYLTEQYQGFRCP